MSIRRPPSTRASVAFTVISLCLAAAVGVMTASSATAADGQQTAPTLTPSPVPLAADNFALTNGTCDGTGGTGWRVQSFIVNGGVDVGSLVFDKGPGFDQVGTDRDNSDGSIASPLWKDNAPGTGYSPAGSPAGLVNPTDLSNFDFSDAGWVLTDGDYQVGYACLDELSTLRQWWSLGVTIDANASPNPFMAAATVSPDPTASSVVVTADPGTSPVGASVTFTATVSPSDAAGAVEFYLGGVSQATGGVSGGTATWTTAALTAGTKSITARFTPSDSLLFDASVSPELSYVVTEADPQVTNSAGVPASIEVVPAAAPSGGEPSGDSAPSGAVSGAAQLASGGTITDGPASAGEPLGATGVGFGPAGVGLVLIYVGRVVCLLGRPRSATG